LREPFAPLKNIGAPGRHPKPSGYNGVMKNARISELRDKLSEYLARVRKGETVIVYDRDTPIARIDPIAPAPADTPEFVLEAYRRGIATPPRIRDGKRLPMPPPKPKKPARLLEALLEERRTGR
jgi:prevent-host-death family protein